VLSLLFTFLARASLSARKSFDRAQEYQTEPEVHEHAKIEVCRIMASGGRQMRHQQEIHCIPRHHGDEALKKVHSSLLRHRRTRTWHLAFSTWLC
jgi:hypothetical protein